MRRNTGLRGQRFVEPPAGRLQRRGAERQAFDSDSMGSINMAPCARSGKYTVIGWKPSSIIALAKSSIVTPVPLGSCTMKHNPRLNEKMARLGGFADIHPLQPQSTLRDFRLIGRVAGEEFRALNQMIDAGRHVMPVRAGADEKRRLARGKIFGREPCKMTLDLDLGLSTRQIEIFDNAARHVREKLRYVGDADRAAHLVAIHVAQGMLPHLDLLGRPLD